MAKRKISITFTLSPEQIREAYRQLLEQEKEDWFYYPEFTEELLQRRAEGRKELIAGETISLKNLKRELGI